MILRLVVPLLAVAACKRDNPPPPSTEVASGSAPVAPVSRSGALDFLEGIKLKMCGCADRACTERVHDELATWTDQQVAASGSSATMFAGDDLRISEELLRNTFACEEAVLAKLPPEKAPPEEKAALRATALLATAREKGRERKARLAASWIEVRYARSDGTLDPAYGELVVAFRAPPPGADDPSRPVGAPTREHAPESMDSDCPTWSFAAKTSEWSAEAGPCMPTVALVPKCTVEQIWTRAIADGAPGKALATISLGVRKGEPAITWRFRIEDRPRQIDIDKRFPDDCAPTP
jgi:hypothetical protein